MKKLNLKSLGLNINDLLSKEQLKNIMGGSGGGSSYKCQCSGGPSIYICGNEYEVQDICNSFCSNYGGAFPVHPASEHECNP